jgi:hypothetical protein
MSQCTAKSKQTGERCKRHTAEGRTVCYYHGGKIPRGIALPQTTTGKYSKHLPTRMLAAYEASQRDPELLGLSEEVNVTDAFLVDLHDRMTAHDTDSWRMTLLATLYAFKDANLAKDADAARASLNKLESLIVNGATPAQCRAEIRHWQDHRRKLAESERKRLIDMQTMVTAEQVTLLVRSLTGVIREHVTDPTALRAIANALSAISMGPTD